MARRTRRTEEWHRVTGVELVWPGKYDAEGNRRPRPAIPRLPLLVVETFPGEPPCVVRRAPPRRGRRRPGQEG